MARPSKGARAYHMVKLHPEVLSRLAEKTAEAGVSSVSQYGADVLALYVGMPEHVRELNQTAIATRTRKAESVQGDVYGRIMVRPHVEVSDRLAHQATGPLVAFIADILTVHVGMPKLVRTRNVAEVLPLAM